MNTHLSTEPIIDKAMEDWNAKADEHNQWHSLGIDEQLELVTKTILELRAKPRKTLWQTT